MKETLDNLFNRFEDIEVYPGHDEIFNIKDAKASYTAGLFP